MPTKTRLTLSALALFLAGWLGYKLNTKQPEVVTKYEDRVVYKEKVVTKDVIRTETKPDGTKIVTETRIAEKSESKINSKTSLEIMQTKTKYSLGLSVRPETLFPFRGIYEVELGRRIGDLPLWGVFSANTEKEFSFGVKWEF